MKKILILFVSASLFASDVVIVVESDTEILVPKPKGVIEDHSIRATVPCTVKFKSGAPGYGIMQPADSYQLRTNELNVFRVSVDGTNLVLFPK